MKLNKQQEQGRIALLAKMEEGLPDIYKKEETFENAQFSGLDPSKISRLKKWQRRTIYTMAGTLFAGFMSTIFYSGIVVSHANGATQKEKTIVENQNKTIVSYEDGLLGNNQALLQYLDQNKKHLTDRQKGLYADLLLKDKRYKDVVDLYKHNINFIASYISTKGDLNTLRGFNTEFPSNDGNFDVYFADKKYPDLLALKSVDMTVKRSEMKTYALMKVGKIDDAEKELANNNNKGLKEKLSQYQDLTNQMNALNKAIAISKSSKKDKDVKALMAKKNTLQNQINAL